MVGIVALLSINILLVCGIADNSDQVNQKITIDISSPEEGDFVIYDVVPAYLFVNGTADTTNGIKNISVSNGIDEVNCGSNYANYSEFSCQVPLSGSERLTVTVVDSAGYHTSMTRNIRKFLGPPPPDVFFVYGTIKDKNGDPVPNASISFSSVKTTRTKIDGTFEKWVGGSEQIITIQKEGYSTFVKKITLTSLTNELNFTILLSNQTSAPLNFLITLLAILFCVLGLSRKVVR